MGTIFTKEEAREANWPCRMCEYEPAKKGSSILPDACKHCDKELIKRENGTSKPSSFELLKEFLIPAKAWGEKGWTTWELQRLRDNPKVVGVRYPVYVDEQGIVTCFILRPGKQVDGSMLDIKTIQKSCHHYSEGPMSIFYVENGKERIIDATVLESYITLSDLTGLSADNAVIKMPKGSWILSFKVYDSRILKSIEKNPMFLITIFLDGKERSVLIFPAHC